MIISETIGSRAQMDFIDYSWKEWKGYKWILRYVYHLSGFVHVAPLKTKKTAVLGRAMICIMSTSVVHKILQSHNGSELLGKCIKYIKKYFPTINIVKGKPRRPQTQGSIEKGNGPFKRALEKWMMENPEAGWPLVGIYVVNAQINTRPTENKATRSAYEIIMGNKWQLLLLTYWIVTF
jgi:hypothetical protein